MPFALVWWSITIARVAAECFDEPYHPVTPHQPSWFPAEDRYGHPHNPTVALCQGSPRTFHPNVDQYSVQCDRRRQPDCVNIGCLLGASKELKARAPPSEAESAPPCTVSVVPVPPLGRWPRPLARSTLLNAEAAVEGEWQHWYEGQHFWVHREGGVSVLAGYAMAQAAAPANFTPFYIDVGNCGATVTRLGRVLVPGVGQFDVGGMRYNERDPEAAEVHSPSVCPQTPEPVLVPSF